MDRPISIRFLEAVVYIDSKEVLSLGRLLHTLDVSCFFNLVLTGDNSSRRSLRKALLGALDIAAAMSCDTYAEKISVLTGRLHEELRASAAEDVFDSCIKELLTEAENEREPLGDGATLRRICKQCVS